MKVYFKLKFLLNTTASQQAFYFIHTVLLSHSRLHYVTIVTELHHPGPQTAKLGAYPHHHHYILHWSHWVAVAAHRLVDWGEEREGVTTIFCAVQRAAKIFCRLLFIKSQLPRLLIFANYTSSWGS